MAIKHGTGRKSPFLSLSPQALKLYIKAARILSSRLKEAQREGRLELTNAITLTISHLMGADAMGRNFTALSQHLQGELALKRLLSLELIDLIESIYTAPASAELHAEHLIICAALCQQELLPTFQQVIVTALMGYVIYRHGTLHWLMNGFLHAYTLYLSGRPLAHDFYPLDDWMRDCLCWISSLFMDAFDTGSLGEKLAIFASEGKGWRVDEIDEVCMLFLWNDSLSQSLRENNGSDSTVKAARP
ncbi:uncharacterized protein Z518_00746 [Rhinocladiella mackenziei CBS 650.93]|uniref:Uncharacterized protein n=1 Tax=Rhinocladiella mackenziei CBS 650.93 TaxID=1442369 RepID=A0A0D2JJN8_9EURO|nr:uncharacterized protein Z518_00746 [Rhinocladiella mackenziei CBS 650.93]KIX09665.1 hypothetical protein Z518_00746 [Rhinocladiella mackenziei CBS 650.93]